MSSILRHARQSNVPMVIDGVCQLMSPVLCYLRYYILLLSNISLHVMQDGLFLVTNNLDLVSGYSLAVLTPNVNEYKRLIEKVLNCEVDNEDASLQLLSLARR